MARKCDGEIETHTHAHTHTHTQRERERERERCKRTGKTIEFEDMLRSVRVEKREYEILN